jgi:hypothetical protein
MIVLNPVREIKSSSQRFSFASMLFTDIAFLLSDQNLPMMPSRNSVCLSAVLVYHVDLGSLFFRSRGSIRMVYDRSWILGVMALVYSLVD